MAVLLFYVQVAELRPPDTVKNYFKGAFQAFYTRSRSNHSKPFIYLKSLKIVCEEVNLWWRFEIPTCNFTKKNSFTHLSSFILPSFSQNTSRSLLPKRLWKSESTVSFWKCKRKVLLLVFYLFNYDSFKSTFFVLNMAIDVLLSTVFIK